MLLVSAIIISETNEIFNIKSHPTHATQDKGFFFNNLTPRQGGGATGMRGVALNENE